MSIISTAAQSHFKLTILYVKLTFKNLFRAVIELVRPFIITAKYNKASLRIATRRRDEEKQAEGYEAVLTGMNSDPFHHIAAVIEYNSELESFPHWNEEGKWVK